MAEECARWRLSQAVSMTKGFAGQTCQFQDLPPVMSLSMSNPSSNPPSAEVMRQSDPSHPQSADTKESQTLQRLQRQNADLYLSLQRTQELNDLYRFIADTAADAIVAIDEHNEIIYANPGLQRLLGYRPFDLMGKPLVTLIPEHLRAAHTQAFERYLQSHQKTINWNGIELEVLHQEGHSIPVEVAFGAMQARDGSVRFTGFLRDIRERKRQEQLTRAQFAKTAHTHRVNTIGAFSSGLAHELNQPLSAICLHAGLITQGLKQEQNSEQAEALLHSAEELIQQSERASSIIKLIRSMIRQESPSMQLVPVKRIFETIRKLVSYRAREAAIDFKIIYPPDHWCVSAQEHQIEQLLLNLINNAFDAVELQSQEQRRVVLSCTDCEIKTFSIHVADTGPGISDDLQNKLFDSFVTSKSDGIGIGLNICQQIAQTHHGELIPRSNTPQGTIMTLNLPAVANSEPEMISSSDDRGTVI